MICSLLGPRARDSVRRSVGARIQLGVWRSDFPHNATIRHHSVRDSTELARGRKVVRKFPHLPPARHAEPRLSGLLLVDLLHGIFGALLIEQQRQIQSRGRGV